MCIYRTQNGVCKKFSVNGDVSYCVEGPCPDEILTNADRIRAMSDEELADFLDKCEAMGYQDSSISRDKAGNCMNMLDWLRQTAEED